MDRSAKSLKHPQSVDDVGPFEYSQVVADGWIVPSLEAHYHPGGRVLVVLDRRQGLELDLVRQSAWCRSWLTP